MPIVPPEVISEQYQLKATFFANSIERQGYVGLFDSAKIDLVNLDDTLNWSNASNFGINPEILKAIKNAELSASQYLCHPLVLVASSKYLSYFRCISALSQKGLKRLSGVSTVNKIETGEITIITPDQAKKFAKAINENLNAIYSISIPEQEKLRGLMYATAGTTLDGSWRNKIGAEGERIVRTLFLKALLSNDEIKKVIAKDGKGYDAKDISAKWLDENTASLCSAITINGAVVLFGSEPDITLLRCESCEIVGVIEIKAGIDPAGALERLGAMMKSFKNIRTTSPDALTILVASCITDEVNQRLQSMKDVQTFILTDVIQDNDKKGALLMNTMRKCIGLPI